MACKYNTTFEERPQRCLECKEPMCPARVPKGHVFIERVPEVQVPWMDENGNIVMKTIGGGALYGVPDKIKED